MQPQHISDNMHEAVALQRETPPGGRISIINKLAAPSGCPALFDGKISLKTHPEEVVDQALTSLPKYFVASDPTSQERCVDGRPKSEWGADGLRPSGLGAQSPGGTPGITLAFRIMKVHELSNDGTFCKDLVGTVELCRQKGIFFGAHIDNHAEHDRTGCTGCGAIDKMPQIFTRMQDPRFEKAVTPYLKAMLGTDYAESRVKKMLDHVTLLNTLSNTYLEKQPDGSYAYQRKAIETVGSRATHAQAIEKLVGNHREVALIVNTVKGTTFDRDRFAVEQGVQAFNYDFWVSRTFAKKFFPTTEERRKEFLTIRAMLALATVMVLTDGTIRLVVRS